MDLKQIYDVVAPYSLEARINAFNEIFRRKGQADAVSFDYECDISLVDSVKTTIAVALYSLTVPFKSYERIQNNKDLRDQIVEVINSETFEDVQRELRREGGDAFLNSSYAVSVSNLEYISSWQLIEFFENFEPTITQIFGLKNFSTLVKYIVANELAEPVTLKKMLADLSHFNRSIDVDELRKNSWTLASLTQSMEGVSKVEDIYAVIRSRLVPAVFDGEELIFLPNLHGALQLSIENMFLYQGGKHLKAVQSQFENFVSDVITKELRRIDQNAQVDQNYYVDDGRPVEQDLLIQSRNYAWIFEIKSSKVQLGLANPKHATNKLQTTYDKNALKASAQIVRVIDAIRSRNRLFRKTATGEENIKIRSKVKKFIGVTVTLWNFSLLAHQQKFFNKKNGEVYPIITIFDLQYLLKSMDRAADFRKIEQYFKFRVDNLASQPIAVDYDELNAYDVYENRDLISDTTDEIPIVASKTPDIVKRVDEAEYEFLLVKLMHFSRMLNDEERAMKFLNDLFESELD